MVGKPKHEVEGFKWCSSPTFAGTESFHLVGKPDPRSSESFPSAGGKQQRRFHKNQLNNES